MAEERKQRGLFKKRRGGILLTKDEVIEIKAGRKKLRRDMRAAGEKSKREFEVVAASLGLYFDANRNWALLKWFMLARAGWILLAAAALLFAVLYGISYISQLKGHFTISMSGKLFQEGFSLSDTQDFSVRSAHLFATPAAEVPCVSMADIPEDVDNYDGEHNGNYFAYTFYLKNEGDKSASYHWEIRLNSETKDVSKATWVMVFEDGVMNFYAEANEDGLTDTIPARDNNDFGYLRPPLYDFAADAEKQYEVIKEVRGVKYWRMIPKPFVSEDVAAEGTRVGIQPGEVHKYTVVVWLEGSDPDCTDDLIGGHIGFEMYMSMLNASGGIVGN